MVYFDRLGHFELKKLYSINCHSSLQCFSILLAGRSIQSPLGCQARGHIRIRDCYGIGVSHEAHIYKMLSVSEMMDKKVTYVTTCQWMWWSCHFYMLVFSHISLTTDCLFRHHRLLTKPGIVITSVSMKLATHQWLSSSKASVASLAKVLPLWYCGVFVFHCLSFFMVVANKHNALIFMFIYFISL